MFSSGDVNSVGLRVVKPRGSSFQVTEEDNDIQVDAMAFTSPKRREEIDCSPRMRKNNSKSSGGDFQRKIENLQKIIEFQHEESVDDIKLKMENYISKSLVKIHRQLMKDVEIFNDK